MRDWLDEVISDDLIAVYEGLFFTEDALLWLRERPRTFGSCGRGTSTGCDGMAANVDDQDLLETLAQDPDTDVRITLVILKARTQMLEKRGARCGLWSLS